ncbi:MAG: alkaline phosphatase family protein [Deltaproteobacteria bacterium]
MRTVSLFAACVALSCAGKVVKLVAGGSDQELRTRPDAGARSSQRHEPPILVLALDGVSRRLLYDMLRAGELPSFEQLFGGDHLAHAYLDDSLLSTLPSTTMAAWVTAMTGVTPAVHGVTGNEYFIREKRQFACPAPVSFNDAAPTLAIYTDRYLDRLAEAPTVYERLRQRDPDILIWVTMNHLFRGADRLLLAKRTAIVNAFEGFLEKEIDEHGSNHASDKIYATLDTAAVDVLLSHLKSGPTPDVLTLYLAGTDLYAHVASEGPDEARRTYLREVVDPQMARVVQALRDRGVLDKTWIVSIADHGHTEVKHDAQHALGAAGMDAGPPKILRAMGYRVRPMKKDVSDRDPFSAVLAYGGAMAYVYLADRSKCPAATDVCPWSDMPRYDLDVLPVADAYWRASREGVIAPELKGTIDLVLVRKPRPIDQIDAPFEVYIGDGKTVPVDVYMADHPHPTYIDFAERLDDLAVGVHGERAGDILLLAHDGDEQHPEDRYYFAGLYHSWHGSPSRGDSEVPLIVANKHHDAAQIGTWVKHVLGPNPRLQKVTDLLIGLREGGLGN